MLSAKVSANAFAAFENLYRDDGVDGYLSDFLSTFDLDTLVTAVHDGLVNEVFMTMIAN